MAKLWASAPPEQFGARRPHAGREPAGEREQPALDAEMQEVVQRFEQAYADFAPDAEETSAHRLAAAEPFPEFADVFQDASPARATATDSARVVAMPRREPEAAPASAPPPPRPRERTDASDGEIDLDEAMTILRASESRANRGPQADPNAQAAKVRASNDA